MRRTGGERGVDLRPEVEIVDLEPDDPAPAALTVGPTRDVVRLVMAASAVVGALCLAVVAWAQLESLEERRKQACLMELGYQMRPDVAPGRDPMVDALAECGVEPLAPSDG